MVQFKLYDETEDRLVDIFEARCLKAAEEYVREKFEGFNTKWYILFGVQVEIIVLLPYGADHIWTLCLGENDGEKTL